MTLFRIHTRFCCFVLLVLFAIAETSQAMPLYRFVDKQCQSMVGAIVATNEATVTLLSLKGALNVFTRQEISAVAEYFVVESPIERFPGASPKARKYRVGTAYLPAAFLGHAIGFIDQSVLFFDERGRTVVVDLNRITHLRPAEEGHANNLDHVAVNFEALAIDSCPGIPVAKEPQVPIEKTYVSEIQLQLLFNRMAEGYAQIDSLAERTLFYQDPIVYDTKSRLGIPYSPASYLDQLGFPEPLFEATLPIYTTFTRGQPYRFQTHFEFGKLPWHSLPVHRPLAGAGSYFKSHLIHGELILNLDGFSAGKQVFFTDENIYEEDLEKLGAKHFAMVQSFNYITLLGFDYRQYSLSFGNYYPVFALRGPLEFRGITPPRSSLVGRFGLKTGVGRFEILGFYTDAKAEGYANPSAPKRELKASQDLTVFSLDYRPESYRMTSHTLRLNWKWAYSEVVSVRSSLVHTQFAYKETGIKVLAESSEEGVTRSSATTLRFQQSDYSAQAGLHLDLSKHVALGAEVTHHIYDSETNSELAAGGESQSITAYQAMFEILL